MAKQAGDFFIEGTIDDLTFYKMCGAHYVRMKTSLTGKRFWRDKAFEGSRKSCSRFGEGNKLASTVFKLVREGRRTNRLFPFLRTRAIALLKEGKAAEEVIWLLVDYLVDFGFIEMEERQKKQVSLFTFPDKKSNNPDSDRDLLFKNSFKGRKHNIDSRHHTSIRNKLVELLKICQNSNTTSVHSPSFPQTENFPL